jgi:uncharacterized membrane protein YeaQ/YmgE (transglycosylase-associated protein family)
MIGMSFLSFLIILIISIVFSLLIHYWGKIQPVKGSRGLLNKICLGWIGGWIGPAVFGNWFEAIKLWDVYIIPAIIGSVVVIYLCGTWAELKKG